MKGNSNAYSFEYLSACFSFDLQRFTDVETTATVTVPEGFTLATSQEKVTITSSGNTFAIKGLSDEAINEFNVTLSVVADDYFSKDVKIGETAQTAGDNDTYSLTISKDTTTTITGSTEAGYKVTWDDTKVTVTGGTSKTKDNATYYKKSSTLSISNFDNDGDTIKIEAVSGSITLSVGDSNEFFAKSGSDTVLTLSGFELSTVDNNLSWDIETSSHEGKYGKKISKGAYVDSDTIKYRNASMSDVQIQINGLSNDANPTVENSVVTLANTDFFVDNNSATVESYTGNYTFALASDVSGKTFTGSSSADTITNAGSTVTINGGEGNDSITNEGNNVSIDGGADNDTIILAGGTNVTVNTNDGNDTIKVKVTDNYSFSVENFTAGDKIGFYDTDSDSLLSIAEANITTTSGGIRVTVNSKTVTINGLNKSEDILWNYDSKTATYYSGKKSAGAYTSSNEINYRAAEEGSELFSLNGTFANDMDKDKLGERISVTNQTVSVALSALKSEPLTEDTTVLTLTNNSNTYKLSLGTGFESSNTAHSADDISWEQDTQDKSKYTYHSNYTTAGYSLAENDTKINYQTSVGSGETFTISGLSDTGLDAVADGDKHKLPDAVKLENKKVTLSSSAFPTDKKMFQSAKVIRFILTTTT